MRRNCCKAKSFYSLHNANMRECSGLPVASGSFGIGEFLAATPVAVLLGQRAGLGESGFGIDIREILHSLLGARPVERATRVKISVKTRGALGPRSSYPCLCLCLYLCLSRLPRKLAFRHYRRADPARRLGGRGTTRPTPGACGVRTRVLRSAGHGDAAGRRKGASVDTARPGISSPFSCFRLALPVLCAIIWQHSILCQAEVPGCLAVAPGSPASRPPVRGQTHSGRRAEGPEQSRRAAARAVQGVSRRLVCQESSPSREAGYRGAICRRFPLSLPAAAARTGGAARAVGAAHVPPHGARPW